MTKYTTEALRKKVINALSRLQLNTYQMMELDEEDIESKATEIVGLFTTQQQALIEEIEKRLPKKKVNIIDEGTATPEESKNPGLNQAVGFNKALNQVTETLEAIRKELK